jgi:hypothetical protein
MDYEMMKEQEEMEVEVEYEELEETDPFGDTTKD